MMEQTSLQEGKQFIVIKTKEEYLGIDIDCIDSIVTMGTITRVPKSQDYFNGVINLRGEIIPVMSLRRKIGLRDDVFDKDTRIVIIKLEPQYPIGVIVDNVVEVISLDEDKIEKSIKDMDGDSTHIYGIGKYGEKLISLLDISRIITK